MGTEFYLDSDWDELGYSFRSTDTTPGTFESWLCCKIVTRALMDFCGMELSPRCGHLDQAQAEVWLLKNNEWFPLICELAGFNPSVVRQVVRKAKYDTQAMEALKRRLRVGRRSQRTYDYAAIRQQSSLSHEER